MLAVKLGVMGGYSMYIHGAYTMYSMHIHTCNVCSLFDNNEARYQKLKSHIEHYIIIQYGLSIFHYDEATNTYDADVFNIYLLPHAFGAVDRPFRFQSSSVEFLCRYKFDFNKVYCHTRHSVQERRRVSKAVSVCL